MTEISQLERARRAIRQADLSSSTRDEFSVDEFSKKSVEKLVAAMDAVRMAEVQTDK